MKKSRGTKGPSFTAALPAGMPKGEKIIQLKARINLARERVNAPKKAPSGVLTAQLAKRALIGVSFADKRISEVMRIANSKRGPVGIAGALIRIWNAQREARLDVLVEDRRLLNKITNKLIDYKLHEGRSDAKPFTLTTAEKRVLADCLRRLPKGYEPKLEVLDAE